eukprot:GHRR01027220.1.p1 GENE.GHRR01027220.1~~GHRR01027220.1.p1  ORF type:complete len:132 (+),score=21.11 GHRR01027220.1:132-527(+)
MLKVLCVAPLLQQSLSCAMQYKTDSQSLGEAACNNMSQSWVSPAILPQLVFHSTTGCTFCSCVFLISTSLSSKFEAHIGWTIVRCYVCTVCLFLLSEHAIALHVKGIAVLHQACAVLLPAHVCLLLSQINA